MYDALGVYLDSAGDDDGRTILVLFTDGGDTRSSISFEDVDDAGARVRRDGLRDRLPGAPVDAATGSSSGRG